MHKFTFPAALVALSVPAAAQAVTVYPGCAVPALKPTHHTFYIDPEKGSQSGDGSAAKPWHTLAEVLNTSNKKLSTMGHNDRTFKNGDTSLSAVNPTGPIKPGDVLMLRSGDHGDVKLLNSFNADFITVMAAPGQTPTLSSLTVTSSGKWLFEGMKVLGAHPNAKGGVTSTVTIGRFDYLGATSDVIFDNGSVSASDDTTSWSDSDWNTKTDSYEVLLAADAKCLAATNNNLYNGMNGIAVEGSNVAVTSNILRRMYNDGIDFYGSNQIIRNNTITNGTNNFSKETLHPDGIQGWSLKVNGVLNTNKNDVIDGNTIIKTGDASISQMQGISIFDGLWDGLQIINNVVVSNVWQGIAIYGGKNVSIINNTVLASDPNYATWILSNYSKDHQPGQNVVIRNNVASNLVIASPTTIFDHNTIAGRIQVTSSTNQKKITTSGIVGNANKIVPSIVNEFVSVDPVGGNYNLRPRSNSAAIGAGASNGAPPYDIVDRRRTDPIDAGAYQH